VYFNCLTVLYWTLHKKVDGNGLPHIKIKGKHFVLSSNWIPLWNLKQFGSDSCVMDFTCKLTILLGTWLKNMMKKIHHINTGGKTSFYIQIDFWKHEMANKLTLTIVLKIIFCKILLFNCLTVLHWTLPINVDGNRFTISKLREPLCSIFQLKS